MKKNIEKTHASVVPVVGERGGQGWGWLFVVFAAEQTTCGGHIRTVGSLEVYVTVTEVVFIDLLLLFGNSPPHPALFFTCTIQGGQHDGGVCRFGGMDYL